MTPNVYIYEDASKQQVFYRGYIKQYTNSPTVIVHTCPKVRSTRFEALNDAKKLIVNLKKQNNERTNRSN